MKNPFSAPRAAILGVLVLWAAGCAFSPQARFYTLTPIGQQEGKPSSPAAIPVSLSIAPVEIPDYLNRPQIVTRDGRNELQLAQFDRWAGALPDNIAAVLAENLSLLLASDRVQAVPRGRNQTSDYTLAVRVLRLDCLPGEQVILKARWVLSSPADGKELVTRVSTLSEKLKDDRYDTAVAAISGALERLSREIAGEIGSRRAGG